MLWTKLVITFFVGVIISLHYRIIVKEQCMRNTPNIIKKIFYKELILWGMAFLIFLIFFDYSAIVLALIVMWISHMLFYLKLNNKVEKENVKYLFFAGLLGGSAAASIFISTIFAIGILCYCYYLKGKNDV